MSMPDPVPVLIADDHPIFRRGLRDIIEEDGRYSVVAECADGEDAVFQSYRLHPRVAVLDMEMPRVSGLDAAERLLALPACPLLLFLTMHDTEPMYRRAMDLGALGFILKDGAADEIVAGLDAVLKGRRFVSPILKNRIMKPARVKDVEQDAAVNIATLTRAERRILQLIAENHSSDEIAASLGISPRTVEGHRSNISHKLGLSGSYALVRFALLNQDLLR